MSDADHSPELRALLARAEREQAGLREIGARVAALRRRRYEDERAKRAPDRDVAAALEAAEAAYRAAGEAFSATTAEAVRASGIPEEVWAAMERSNAPFSDPVDRNPRASVRADAIASTALLEDVVQDALDRIVPLAPPSWWDAQSADRSRVEPDFLTTPLAVFRGTRVAGERRLGHRFAQMVQLGRDFLAGDPGYDWFAGALLVPQLAALGSKLPALADVAGDVQGRIDALWRLGSDKTDATAYELLVGASCAEKGRAVEFLSTTQAKTPDLRLHDYPFPVVAECKRRQLVTDLDASEDAALRALYAALRPACLGRGMTGVVVLRLAVPSPRLPVPEVVDAAVRQRLTPDPRRPTAYAWGSVAFTPGRCRIGIAPTPLYSPRFLREVFGWDTDLPTHDGIVCQVRSPTRLTVDEAREPLALVWTNEDPAVLRRRARTAAGLIADAIGQIPPGEVGLVYVCYQEGDREAVADDRTAFLRRQLQDWTHAWPVRVPAIVMSRIIPRALGDGGPDLVETAQQFTGTYGGEAADPTWFGEIPSLVFAPPRPHGRVVASPGAGPNER